MGASTAGGDGSAERDELSAGDLMSVPNDPPGGVPPLAARTPWSEHPVSAEDDPLLGTTLHDTYVVTRVLGEGGMGRVYEAHHTRISSKRYAIKVLHSEFSLNPEIRLRFQREAEAAATIEHPGVVGTYDVGKTPQGWPYMVCEYLAGVDLNDYQKKHGALPARTVVHIGKQLCSALRAAHSRGVIHRDLKPHNIFVIQDHERDQVSRAGPGKSTDLPTVKVLDFGLSRFVESDNELTKTGIILGTPGYMAPEQANGRETDLRTDIYGIGALLYAAATGRPPFKEETPQLTVLTVMSGEPPRPRDVSPSIPVDLEIIIQKAMSRDPQNRYQSADDMEAALAHLYSTSTPLDRRGLGQPDAPPVAPRVSLVLYALAALFLGGLSCAGALFALLEIKGVAYGGFRLSALEWLLFVLLGLLLLYPLGLFVRSFKRRTWNNSARVAELLPRIRRPLVAATIAYGLSALVVRASATATGIGSGSLAHSATLSTLILYVVLPLNALLAASAVALRDAFRNAKNVVVRLITGVGYSAGTLGAGLLLLTLALKWEPPFERTADLARTSTVLSKEHDSKVGSPLPSIPAAKEATEGDPGTTGPTSTVLDADAPRATPPLDAPAEPSAPSEESVEHAPKAEVAIAKEEGADALTQLSKKYPKDARVLKSLVLAHASRADTLDQSAKAIARLLDVDPDAKEDADVLFILKKALLSKGAAHTAAAATVKNQLGEDGAELVYQVMAEHPKQRHLLVELFQDLRRTRKASPEVLVAYDLRYASSCRGRLDFLDRAEQYGDKRSLQQLRALSTAPRRCGWGRTCYPPCRAEADRFRQSAKVIERRLAAQE